jgi:hypothetical protein
MKLKHRKEPTAARGRGSSAADLQEQLDRRTRELTEAREQQTATAQILHVISTSPTDVQPVFETIVRNAVSLCGSLFANVFRFDGELLHFEVTAARLGHNVERSYVDLLQRKYPMRPDSSQISGRVLLTRSVVRLEDALTDPDYDQRFPLAMGPRRMLGVPMLREGKPLGVIVVGWAEPGPVSKIQEELLKAFADQAVIAIENVRLFDDVQARTRELTESLQQQTATSEVLQVISSSPGELEPVFQAMLENATRICAAKFGLLWLADGDGFRAVGLHGVPPALGVARRRDQIVRFGPDTPFGRMIETKRLVHVSDITVEPAYRNGFPQLVELADIAGARTLLSLSPPPRNNYCT